MYGTDQMNVDESGACEIGLISIDGPVTLFSIDQLISILQHNCLLCDKVSEGEHHLLE